MRDPTQRFSDRVEDYIKARPSYPEEIVPFLAAECGLTPEAIIADVGSGTGLLAELWLQAGNRVFGVEPNAEMRAAGERLLAAYPRFISAAGAAEETMLPDASVDFVSAGQAFHWFDPPRAALEFARILRPGGWVVLVWNVRQTEATPFMAAYERLLLTYAPEYPSISAINTPNGTDDFGLGVPFRVRHFANRQRFDFDGLEARLLSSSYTPRPGDPLYEPMLADLARIFEQHAEDGQVSFKYDTQVYYGHHFPTSNRAGRGSRFGSLTRTWAST